MLISAVQESKAIAAATQVKKSGWEIQVLLSSSGKSTRTIKIIETNVEAEKFIKKVNTLIDSFVQKKGFNILVQVSSSVKSIAIKITQIDTNQNTFLERFSVNSIYQMTYPQQNIECRQAKTIYKTAIFSVFIILN